ncbi:hypothetical protein HN51_062707, partial [Arachis hypogaea]
MQAIISYPISAIHKKRTTKRLEHIVLVHYRETQESQGSPVTLVNSHSSSASVQPWLSEELDSGTNTAYTSEFNDNLMVESHEMKLHELNTLEWDDLVLSNDNTSIAAS